MDDDAIRAIVRRLARPAPTGHVIERVAILAEGPNYREIEAWILRKGGQPEATAPRAAGRGLYAEREASADAARETKTSRYVLPPDALG
jgi:hypothetical protein